MKAFEDFKESICRFIDSPILNDVVFQVEYKGGESYLTQDSTPQHAVLSVYKCTLDADPDNTVVQVTYHFLNSECNRDSYYKHSPLLKSEKTMYCELPDVLKHEGGVVKKLFTLATKKIDEEVRKSEEIWEQFQSDFNYTSMAD